MESLHSKQFTLNSAWDFYEESGEIDILRILLAIIISRFTDSQVVLTAVYAIIFGFFYSRNLCFVIDGLDNKVNLAIKILLICFAFVIPFWFINGFRMWTAAQIFIYGIFRYKLEKKLQTILVCSISIFVHFSFLFPCLLLIPYMVIGNRSDIYFGIFIISIFVSAINIELFNKYFETYMPVDFIEKTRGYRIEDQVLDYRQNDSDVVWYADFYDKLLSIYIEIMIILAYIKFRKGVKTDFLLRLISFTLLFYAFSNLSKSVPSGGRFLIISHIFSLTFLILFFNNYKINKSIKRLIFLSLPILILFIIVSLRVGLYSISLTTIFGNPLIMLLTFGENLSINDIIK